MGAASSKQFPCGTSSAEDMYGGWSSKWLQAHTLHIKFDGNDHEQLGMANPMRTFRIAQGCVIINDDEPCESIVDNGRLLWSRKIGVSGVEVGAFAFTKLSPYATGSIGQGAVKTKGGKAVSFSAYFSTEDEPAMYATQIQPDETPWLGIQLSVAFPDDGNDIWIGKLTGALQTTLGSLDAATGLKQYKYDDKVSSQLLLTTSSAEGNEQYLTARVDIPIVACENGYPYVRAELQWMTSDFSQLTGTLYRYDPSKESNLGDTVQITGEKIAGKRTKAHAPLAVDVGCCTRRSNYLAEAAKISRQEMQGTSLSMKELMRMSPNPQDVNNMAFSKLTLLMLYHLSSADPDTFAYFGAIAPVVGKDLTQAEADLLNLPGVRDFLEQHAKKVLAQAFETSKDPKIQEALTKELRDKLTFYFRGNTSDSACLQNHPSFTALMPKLSDFARIKLTQGLDKYLNLNDSDRSTWAHKFHNAIASDYFMNLNISCLEATGGSTGSNYATLLNMLWSSAKAPDSVLSNLSEAEIEAFTSALRAEFADGQAGAVSQFFQSHPALGVDIMYDIEARARAAYPNSEPVIDSLEASWKLQASKLMIYGVDADGLVCKQQSSTITTSSSWVPVGLEAASSVAVSGRTIFGVDKYNNTIKKKLLSNGAAGMKEWDQLSNSTARSIAMHGPTMYIAGINYKIYKQNIEHMTLTSDWVQAGDGLMVSIAISMDGVIYGIGTDGHLYKQSLSSMTTSSPWTFVAAGQWISVAISGGVLYCVGTDQKVYSAHLSNMTTTSQWTQISAGNVISVAVPKQSWVPLSLDYYTKQKKELLKTILGGAKLKGTDTDPAKKQKFSDFFKLYVSKLYEQLTDPKSKFDPKTKQDMIEEMNEAFHMWGCSNMKELLDLNSHLIDELAAVICSSDAGNILMRFTKFTYRETKSILYKYKALRALGLMALYGFAAFELTYLLYKTKGWSSMTWEQVTLVVLGYVDLFANLLTISRTLWGKVAKLTVRENIVNIEEYAVIEEEWNSEVWNSAAWNSLSVEEQVESERTQEEEIALETADETEALELATAQNVLRMRELGGKGFSQLLGEYSNWTVKLAKGAGMLLMVANAAYDVFNLYEDAHNGADAWTVASDSLEATSDLMMLGFFCFASSAAIPLVGWAFAAVGILATLLAAWCEGNAPHFTPTEKFVLEKLVPVIKPMKSPDPKWLASLPPLKSKMGEIDERRGTRGGA